MRTTAGYGTWESPLDPARMVSMGRRYGAVRFADDGGVTWVEQRPAEGGRLVPVHRGRDGTTRDLIPPGFNARTRVHEYGGRAHVADGDTLWFANFDDQRLYRAHAGVAEAVSQDPGFRFAEPLVDRARARIIAVGEHHTPGARYPENGIVAVDMRSGAVTWLLRGHDFVATPRLSPDGRRLSFVAWEHPSMAWDAAALYVADVRSDGSLGVPARVAGDDTASVNGVLWRDDDSLVFALEADDRWQPHVWERGAVRRLAPVPGEFGVALWHVGTQTFALASRDELVGVAQRDGLSVIVAVDLRPDGGPARVLREDLSHVGALDARGDELALVVGFDTGGLGVLRVERTHAGRASTDTTPGDELVAGALPEGPPAEVLRFPAGDGAHVHGFLHHPDNPAYEAPAGALPPLLVVAHGGPTGAASPLPSATVRFWTSRGFAVLDVNYRGSTGFGRAYRDALRGRWGELDVADCVAGARWLAAEGRVRADACFIRGASAGGLTVLQALCHHDVFRGGACFYGISDPRSLGAETHKLESRYEVFLFGEGAAFEAAMATRTPLANPERIRVPVVFFQGLEDLAVPPAQTRRIHDALTARGVASEFHGYAGEQHGFRKAETIVDVFTRELAFYQRLL